jgi:Cdc6-like AAA superfamily ATPase
LKIDISRWLKYNKSNRLIILIVKNDKDEKRLKPNFQ